MNSYHEPYSKLVVNLDNLEHNIKVIKDYVKADLIIVLKNNAYGNGIKPVGKFLETIGVNKFAVISLDEAEMLRETGVKSDILIMGKIPYKDFEKAVSLNAQLTIFELEELLNLEKVCKKLNKKSLIQLNIETGMNRLGVNFDLAKDIINIAESSDYIKIAGIYSHFSSPNDLDYSNFQSKNFKKFINSLKKKYYYHFSNSVPSFKYPESWYDGVRIGILSWGVNQSSVDLNLKKVGSLKSRIIKIMNIKKNESVGYDRKFITNKNTKIALLQIGYGDGLPYNLNNEGMVFIKNNFYKIVGSVCMDHIFVEVDNNVNVGDEAEIFGENLPIESMASSVGTIPYDIMVKIAPTIKRAYVKNGKILTEVQGDIKC